MGTIPLKKQQIVRRSYIIRDRWYNLPFPQKFVTKETHRHMWQLHVGTWSWYSGIVVQMCLYSRVVEIDKNAWKRVTLWDFSLHSIITESVKPGHIDTQTTKFHTAPTYAQQWSVFRKIPCFSTMHTVQHISGDTAPFISACIYTTASSLRTKMLTSK